MKHTTTTHPKCPSFVTPATPDGQTPAPTTHPSSDTTGGRNRLLRSKPPEAAPHSGRAAGRWPQEVWKKIRRIARGTGVPRMGWRLPPIEILGQRPPRWSFSQADNAQRGPPLSRKPSPATGVEGKVVQINAGPTVDPSFGVEPGLGTGRTKQIKERDPGTANVSIRLEEVGQGPGSR